MNNRPASFHVMAKPTGSQCNLACEYCFYLKKGDLYPESDFCMADEVHETYIRDLFEAHRVPRVTVAWQGGEPTLMGLDFFRRSIELQRKYRKPGTHIENTIQTNGTLLDEAWCRFLRSHNFLVGLSLDGPRELHDAFRKDRRGNGTFDRVIDAVRLLQKYGVEFNILCSVNSRNADYPMEVYRFFRDVLDIRYIQFIPIVERIGNAGFAGSIAGQRVTERSVRPEQWGEFLKVIFCEWVKKDVGSTYVLNFDALLSNWVGGKSPFCIFSRRCGQSMALEHNGDLYSCDHFVEPLHKLGNIMHTPMIRLASSGRQDRFGNDKSDMLPKYCRTCQFLFACNGECPKNRFAVAPDGELHLNYLCTGYKVFFKYADKPMRIMADLILRGRAASDIMSYDYFCDGV
ncbi:MAG: anaerobic sulfatase maturase [Chlorobiaceae bacterium]|nr:anaerobic sulfatase maturase [Chlorobiaceae bacterium]